MCQLFAIMYTCRYFLYAFKNLCKEFFSYFSVIRIPIFERYYRLNCIITER